MEDAEKILAEFKRREVLVDAELDEDRKSQAEALEEKLAARTDALLGNTAADREAELRAREEELRIREEELAMAKLNLDEERKRKAAKAAVPPIPCTRAA